MDRKVSNRNGLRGLARMDSNHHYRFQRQAQQAGQGRESLDSAPFRATGLGTRAPEYHGLRLRMSTGISTTGRVVVWLFR
jgi:hypothetical protein